MASYKDLWNKRHFLELDSLSWRPFQGWKDERKEHLVFLVRIKDAQIIKRITKIQSELIKSDNFIPFPIDFFHITIKPLGFLAQKKQKQDDYTKKEIKLISAKIRQELLEFQRMNIVLKNINLFPDCVFIEVEDSGFFTKLNNMICSINGITSLWRDVPNFLPHISIGTFKHKNKENLVNQVENLRETIFGSFTCNSFELVVAIWDAKYPHFKTIREFPI